MSYSLKSLAELFEIIVANTVDDVSKLPLNQQSNPPVILHGGGCTIQVTNEETGQTLSGTTKGSDPTLYIGLPGAIARKQFVAECLKARDFARLIGGKAVEQRVTQLLKERVLGSKALATNGEQFIKDELVKQLRSEVCDWTVRMPIKNLVLQTDLAIGRVTFVGRAEGQIANLRMILQYDGPEGEPKYTPAMQANGINLIEEITGAATAWAVANIESHVLHLGEVAREHINAAISVVRAFTNLYSMRGTAFGFSYELAGDIAGLVAEAKGKSDFHIATDQRSFFPFTLTKAILDKMRTDLQFDCLTRIAGSDWDSLNTLEQAIRVAFHWIGRSVIALSRADSFVYCTIAIERLLFSEKDSTTEAFADRLALLLTPEQEGRKAIHKSAKRLYNIRSEIVHAGREEVSGDEFEEIESLSLETLVRVVEFASTLKSHDQLRAMLHDLKLA